MKTLFFLLLFVLLYLALTKGLAFCWNGACNEFKIQVLQQK